MVGCRAKLNDLRHKQGQIEVRLRLLSEYENKLEGLGRGVKDVIKEMGRLRGICGIVADLFQVDKEYETAIETALGGRVQNIITEDRDAAKEAIEFLKRERRGRATFLPLDDVRGRSDWPRDIMRESGVIGVASDLIQYDKQYRPAFESLLGGTIICETLDHAMLVRRRHRPSALLVTLDGDVINPGGAMTGGRQQGRDAGGLVSRKNEIHRLNEELDELNKRREQLATDSDQQKKAAFDLAVSVDEQRKVISVAERSVGDAKATLMKAERDRSHLQEFAASFDGQLQEIKQELDRVDADKAELEQQQHEQQQSQEAVLRDLERMQQELHQQGSIRDSIQEEVNHLRVNMATSEERREGLRNHLGHLRQQMSELHDQRQERERRIEQHGERRQQFQQQVAENDVSHRELSERFNTLSAKAEAIVKKRDELRNENEEERQEAKKLANEARHLERDRTQREIKLGEIKVRLDGL